MPVARKVCVLTGSRAEFDLLAPLLARLREDPHVALSLIVTGSHLSPEFGNTWRQVEEAGFTIDRRVDMLLSSDTAVGISKSMGLAQIGMADALEELSPSLLVLLGDRYELLPAAGAAVIARVPIAHIHGGERTEGAVDELIRHAITKLSHLHFTATDEYRRRVVQMGEDASRVFNVGSLGAQNARTLRPTPLPELAADLGVGLEKGYLLVTFHPATWDEVDPRRQVGTLLDALEAHCERTGLGVVFTAANADAGGRDVNSAIAAYCEAHSGAALFTSLGRQRYLSLVHHASTVVGNSSSGIIEAPSLGVPTVNVGMRQDGRVKAPSVIDVKLDAEDIRAAMVSAGSPSARKAAQEQVNPYGHGDVAGAIHDVLATFPLDSLRAKSFVDLAPSAGEAPASGAKLEKKESRES